MDSDLSQRIIPWVRQVFKNENFEHIDIKLPDCDSSGGNIADIIFATVIAVQNGIRKTIHVIIKRSKNTDLGNDSKKLHQVYLNEIYMYSKFMPYLEKFAKERNVSPFEHIPHCYGTITNENLFVILMENLKQEGFKIHPLDKRLDLDHVKLLLEAFAKWHALCFALKDQCPAAYEEFRKCNETIPASDVFSLMAKVMKKQIDFAISFFEKRDRPLVTEKLRMLKQKYDEYSTSCLTNKDEDYIVFRHGDCWNNNFLFHYDEAKKRPDKVMVIDWQLTVPGSPLVDITQVFFSCCSREGLEHIDYLLQFYYHSLSKILRELGSDPKKCFPEDAMMDAFRRYAPLAIASVPLSARATCSEAPDTKNDNTKTVDTENINDVFGGKLKDVEGYFTRINSIMELCIERGYL